MRKKAEYSEHLKQYYVSIHGLTNEGLTETFLLNDAFLEAFPESQYQHAAIKATAHLFPLSDFILMEVHLSGPVEVACSRCLEPFDYQLKNNRQFYLTHNYHVKDDDKDLVYYDPDQTEVNIAQELFEMVHLAVPLQITHPLDADGQPSCNPEMLELLEKHQPGSSDDDQETVDPRWEKLKNLKNNTN